MNIGFLILAHDNPQHLEKLIASLDHPNSYIFVHIDRKSGDKSILNVVNQFKENIIMCKKRHNVFWGEFSIVVATLELIKLALHSRPQSDYLVLISGKDYPLRSINYIHQYLSLNKDIVFMNCDRVPSVKLGKPTTRLTTYNSYHLNSKMVNAFSGVYKTFRNKNNQRDYREHFGHVTPYAGSQWWAMPATDAAQCLNFKKAYPNIHNFYKNTVCPDESYFQTAVNALNRSDKIFSNITYADWKGNNASPETITKEHIKIMTSANFLNQCNGKSKISQFLFARKFDDTTLPLLLELPCTI